jgi:hypothetical protein
VCERAFRQAEKTVVCNLDARPTCRQAAGQEVGRAACFRQAARQVGRPARGRAQSLTKWKMQVSLRLPGDRVGVCAGNAGPAGPEPTHSSPRKVSPLSAQFFHWQKRHARGKRDGFPDPLTQLLSRQDGCVALRLCPPLFGEHRDREVSDVVALAGGWRRAVGWRSLAGVSAAREQPKPSYRDAEVYVGAGGLVQNVCHQLVEVRKAEQRRRRQRRRPPPHQRSRPARRQW